MSTKLMIVEAGNWPKKQGQIIARINLKSLSTFVCTSAQLQSGLWNFDVEALDSLSELRYFLLLGYASNLKVFHTVGQNNFGSHYETPCIKGLLVLRFTWRRSHLENLAKGPFIYYVITFLGFLDPPPPLCQHVFSTKNKQKLAFSDPPTPPTIYEWSLK